MSANPISDPLAFPIPGFTPGVPGYDPNWYDPNFNPYGEPTPPVQPDFTPPIAAPVTPVVPPIIVTPPLEPTPSSPPATPSSSSSGSSSSGGPSTRSSRVERVAGAAERDAIIREAAQRAARDTEIRAGRAVVIEGELASAATRRAVWGVLGPIGVIITEALTPNRLGTGTVDPLERAVDAGLERRDELQRQVDDMLERLERMSSGRPSIGQDIARGGGVIAGGIVLGAEVLRDVLEQPGPVAIGDTGELGVDVDVPAVSFPELEIEQPRVPQTAPPPIPEIPTPWPTQPAAGSTATAPSAPVGRPSTSVRTPLPSTTPFSLRGLWTSVLRRSSTSSRVWSSSFVDPLTQPFADTIAMTNIPTPIATSMPAGSTASPTSPLTGFNTQVLGSSPPRARARQRTTEDRCRCKTKPRKKPRECGARGNLMWVSGPKKGKPAGSRCVSFKGK